MPRISIERVPVGHELHRYWLNKDQFSILDDKGFELVSFFQNFVYQGEVCLFLALLSLISGGLSEESNAKR